MKNLKYLLLLAVLIFSGCISHRNITEQYITNNIIQAKGETCTLSLYSKYIRKTRSYVEVTGYKQGNNKGVIIGVEKKRKRKEPVYSNGQSVWSLRDYISLDASQCKLITDSFPVFLLHSGTKHDMNPNETAYKKFYVSPDLYFTSSIVYDTAQTVKMWVKGNPYAMKPNTLITRLRQFSAY